MESIAFEVRREHTVLCSWERTRARFPLIHQYNPQPPLVLCSEVTYYPLSVFFDINRTLGSAKNLSGAT